MSTSHLYSLRVEKRRERLEWLGDIVLEEISVRLIARQALAALDWEEEEEEEEEERKKNPKESDDREEAGSGEGGGAAASAGPSAGRTDTEAATELSFGVPAALRPLSWRLDFATRLAVSNANLRAVYEDQLVGLMGFVGLEEDQLLLGLSGVGGGGAGGGGGIGKRKRRRSSSFSGSGVAAGLSSSAKKVKTGKDKRMRCRSASFVSAADAMGAPPASANSKVNKWDKRMPDMVEAAIGEAFEASLCLGLDGGRGGGSGAEAIFSSGPQRFAGGHRAALVDRLLSTALSTKYFLSGLQEPRASGRGGGGGGDSRAYGGEGEGPYAYDDDFVSSSGFANSFGALYSSSSSSSDEESEDESEVDGKKRARKGRGGAQDSEETPVARGIRAGAEDAADDAAAAADGVDRSESIAAGREGVLRLYGAVLLKFRASVFLFCSAEAAERGGENATGAGAGDGDTSAESRKHGPFELTLRRQGVMSAENLEAVAEHLLSLRKDGADGPGQGVVGVASTPVATKAAAAAAAGARHRARDWMRAEVGRAALCGGGSVGYEDGLGVAFSTRVAALLLSRSGERDGPPKAQGERRRAPAGEENDAPVVGARARAAAAMAVAEAQFGRDPWPEDDLPRASQQAARVFLPPGASIRGASSGAASTSVRPRGTPSPSPVPTANAPQNEVAAAAGKKRKREGGGEPFRVPPQYVGLLGQLPRDSRHLLARLGHQGYVKVLEDLLRGFLGVLSADSASDTGISNDNVDFAVNPGLTPGSSARDGARDPGTPGSDDDRGPDHDQLQDPWRALQAGRPHPSLSGLVEPPELASAGVKRMILPMPNPFYRRVLHALCRVHGLTSCGGETHQRARVETGAGGKEGRGRTAAGYRTVEVTRGYGGGGGGWGRVKRPGDTRSAVDDGNVLTLIPVETLLAER